MNNINLKLKNKKFLLKNKKKNNNNKKWMIFLM